MKKRNKHMTMQIEFEGFVNETKGFSWGWVAKVAHSQRAKNDATGEWETVGKDYIDVVLPDGVNVNEGDLVRVKGSLKADAYISKNGDAKPALKVRATSVESVDRRSSNTSAPNDGWGTPAPIPAPAQTTPLRDEEIPF